MKPTFIICDDPRCQTCAMLDLSINGPAPRRRSWWPTMIITIALWMAIVDLLVHIF